VQTADLRSACRGHFEQLAHVVGIAFDQRVAGERICASGGALDWFSWSPVMLEGINRPGDDIRDAQMDCVAYFRELLLDLYLATSENVSRSPGFEKYLVYAAAQATQGQDAAGDDDDADE
jgi:hypothetical protein